MPTFLFVACLFAGSIAFAAKKYDLKMEVSIDGRKVSSPNMTVIEGEKATYEQTVGGKKRFIEVTARSRGTNADPLVVLDMNVGLINKDGSRTPLSSPQITSKLNEPAAIHRGSANGGLLSIEIRTTEKAE